MATSQTGWAALALIRRPQGRRGEVFADLLTDFPEKFSDRKQLWLIADEGSSAQIPVARELSLNSHWLHKGGVVLHFAGVDSISAAEELKGLIVAIPQGDRMPLDEGGAYITDLVGCMLVDVAGPSEVSVGLIDDVDRSAGPVALLVIRRNREEILVPFAKSYLRKIDLDAKRVEMSLPEGLVDLNR